MERSKASDPGSSHLSNIKSNITNMSSVYKYKYNTSQKKTSNMQKKKRSSYHSAEYCPGTLEDSDSWGKCQSLWIVESSALLTKDCTTSWTLHVWVCLQTALLTSDDWPFFTQTWRKAFDTSVKSLRSRWSHIKWGFQPPLPRSCWCCSWMSWAAPPRCQL